MNRVSFDRVREILADSTSLSDADDALAGMGLGHAIAWGLFDGWKGRPRTTSGLVTDTLAKTPSGKRVVSDYLDAYFLGKDMAVGMTTAATIGDVTFYEEAE